MRWEVEFAPPAQRFLRKLDRIPRDAIAAGLRRLVGELGAGTTPLIGVRKLVGAAGHRLRVGVYRVVFQLEARLVESSFEGEAGGVEAEAEVVGVVRVERIGHRGDVYRDL